MGKAEKNASQYFIWRIIQQYGSFMLKMVVQIVLARILLPGEFGTIAIVMVFIGIAEVIASGGLGTALVQKKNPEAIDYSTVFTSSFIVSIVLYIIIFSFAPIIAEFYHDDSIVRIFRILGLIVFPQSYLSVLNAYVQKNFEFKKSCIGTIISVVISGILAIIIAINGGGVWTLVAYSMLTSFLSVVVIRLMLSWHPLFGFEFVRFKKMFSFSWKVLASSLIGTFIENIYTLSFGRLYSNELLGYYKQGNVYADAILGQTRISISSVVFPIFASLQDNIEHLKKTVLKMIHICVTIVFPMAFGLAAIAETFIIVVLTDKWLYSVFFIRVECIFYSALAVAAMLGDGIMAIGRSDISMKIEISKLIAAFLCIITLGKYGLTVLCVGRVAVSLVFLLIFVLFAKRLLYIGYMDIIRVIYKPFIISAIMGLIVYLISLLRLNSHFLLAAEIIVGFLIYLLEMRIFMREDLAEMKQIIGKILRKNVKHQM